MTKVACVVRQSQGSDDSISLEHQRETTRELAAELGDDEPEMIDFGNHTGFSLFVKTEEQQCLDSNPRSQMLQTGLQNGEWDYLVAYDDTRLARDQYYWVLQHCAIRGGVEIEFVADVPADQLTFRVQRAVEAEVKRKEIEKTRDAVARRQENGMHQGAAPFGLTHDDGGEYLVRDSEEWPQVVRAFEGIDDADTTYSDIVDECDGISSTSTVSRIKQRRSKYEKFDEDGEIS